MLKALAGAIRNCKPRAGIPDKDTQEKIDIVKSRLVKGYGYCDTCSNDVLSFVASIFARGSSKE